MIKFRNTGTKGAKHSEMDVESSEYGASADGAHNDDGNHASVTFSIREGKRVFNAVVLNERQVRKLHNELGSFLTNYGGGIGVEDFELIEGRSIDENDDL